MFLLFKRGVQKGLPCLGGDEKVSDPRFSHCVAPLPVINDQSLKATTARWLLLLIQFVRLPLHVALFWCNQPHLMYNVFGRFGLYLCTEP